jgi:cation:H+ antiporter
MAFGTSAPELAMNLTTTLRGSTDISFGNAIGSNLFNLAVVLGATAALRPIPVPAGGVADLTMLCALSMLLWWVCATQERRIIRAEGALLLTVYLIYVSARALL